MVLFIMLYKLSTLWMKSYSVPIQTKTSEQYFPGSLFILKSSIIFLSQICSLLVWKILQNSLNFAVTGYLKLNGKSQGEKNKVFPQPFRNYVFTPKTT